MDRVFVALGSISAFIGVALGAFAAHGLKTRVADNLLVIFEIGVRYQLYHALALLAVGLAYARWPGPVTVASGFMFVVGTVLFSGSLYALSLTEMRWFGAITPFGGVAFLGGWLCLAWAAVQR